MYNQQNKFTTPCCVKTSVQEREVVSWIATHALAGGLPLLIVPRQVFLCPLLLHMPLLADL